MRLRGFHSNDKEGRSPVRTTNDKIAAKRLPMTDDCSNGAIFSNFDFFHRLDFLKRFHKQRDDDDFGDEKQPV